MRILYIVLVSLVMVGCTTTGHFKVPEGSSLYINERSQPVDIKAGGEVTTTPFTWQVSGIPPERGIPYRLEKGGKTLKEGKLRTKFRVVSIFWPPLADLYWPMGFNPDITYDLVNDKQE